MVKVHFDISSKSEFQGLLKWAYTANARTIHAGEQEIQIATEGSVTKEVELRVPPVNEGVAFPTELSASITQDGQVESIASFTRRITIFHRNPLFERSKWLKELSISLFDPPGDTADVFQMMEIPFDRIRNVEALPKLEGGLLIVGEGVSFERYRFLAKHCPNWPPAAFPFSA